MQTDRNETKQSSDSLFLDFLIWQKFQWNNFTQPSGTSRSFESIRIVTFDFFVEGLYESVFCRIHPNILINPVDNGFRGFVFWKLTMVLYYMVTTEMCGDIHALDLGEK